MMTKNKKMMRFSGDSKEKRTTTKAASQLPLPEDILIDIVARLPVKSILRFKAVSKECGAMVASPHFITTHLIHATFNNKVGVSAPAAASSCKGIISDGSLRGGRRSTYSSGLTTDYADKPAVSLSFQDDGYINQYLHLPLSSTQDYSSY